MKLFASSLLMIHIFFMSGSLHAQDEIIRLWPDKVPNRIETDETEQWDTTDIIRISRVQYPEMAVYLPEKSKQSGLGVLVFPGGGYHILAYDWEGTEIAKWLNSQGIAAFVVNYRLPVSKSLERPHEVPLMDAQRAIRLVRGMHGKWGVDPEKIGVIGFSAGGHLASCLGTLYDMQTSPGDDEWDELSARPDFMALIYPVITFVGPAVHKGSKSALLGKDPDDSLIRQFSTELQVTDRTPPTFLVHASDDMGVKAENSTLFYNALLQEGVPAALHIYPRGGHGFSLAKTDPYLHNWTLDFSRWLVSMGFHP